MPDEDETAKPKKLPASLVGWADKGDPNETRTVIFRIAPDANPQAVSDALAELQVNVTSAGAAVIVGAVPRRSLVQAAEMPEVLRIEEPMRLSPKGGEKEADFLKYRNTKGIRLPDD